MVLPVFLRLERPSSPYLPFCVFFVDLKTLIALESIVGYYGVGALPFFYEVLDAPVPAMKEPFVGI